MKKVISLILITLLTISLIGCTTEKTSEDKKEKASTEATKNVDTASQKPSDTKQNTQSSSSKNKSTPELEQKLFDAIKQWKGLDTTQRVENIKKVIDEGADVNAIDPKNKLTPLIMAAMNKNIEMIDLFLQNGADINKLTEKGENVLFYCFQDEKTLSYLISKGADPGIKDKDGKTYKDSKKLSSN